MKLPNNINSIEVWHFEGRLEIRFWYPDGNCDTYIDFLNMRLSPDSEFRVDEKVRLVSLEEYRAD